MSRHRAVYALGSDDPNPPAVKGGCARKKITIKRRDGLITEFMGREGKDCPPALPTARQLAWRALFGEFAGKAAKDCKPVPVAVKGACLRTSFATQRGASPGFAPPARVAAPQIPDFSMDIPFNVAQAAHAGSSFVPEQRAKQEQDGYASQLRSDFETLAKYATTPEKKALLETEFARYRAGYRAKTLAHLHSRAGVMSSMITGASNFPTERNQKRLETEHKRLDEVLDFRRRALAAIRRTLTPELQPIPSGDADAGQRIETKVEKLEKLQAQMKLCNATIRKHAKEGPETQVAALVALGLFGAERARSLLKPDFLGRIGFADYEITNNAANIRRLKKRAVAVERDQALPDADQANEETGIRLEDSPADNRVRLFFPGKPDVAVRDALKAHGFRWAPSQGAWSAYRNHNSLSHAQSLVRAGSPGYPSR